MTQRFVAEVGAEMIGLFPYLRLDGKKRDQIGGADAERLGSLADACLDSVQNIEDNARRRPEADVLAAQIEPAFGGAGIQKIRMGQPAIDRLGIAQLEEQGP